SARRLGWDVSSSEGASSGWRRFCFQSKKNRREDACGSFLSVNRIFQRIRGEKMMGRNSSKKAQAWHNNSQETHNKNLNIRSFGQIRDSKETKGWKTSNLRLYMD